MNDSVQKSLDQSGDTADWEQRFDELLNGIDQTETEINNGWWETSAGAIFGAKIKATLYTEVQKFMAEARKEGIVQSLSQNGNITYEPSLTKKEIRQEERSRTLKLIEEIRKKYIANDEEMNFTEHDLLVSWNQALEILKKKINDL